MRIFKTRLFDKWSSKQKLDDRLLSQVIQEMAQGLVDADLGESIYKKRISLSGRGKRGGARTIIAYKAGSKAFFIFGYAKNKKANMDASEKKLIKLFARELLNYSVEELEQLIKTRELIEVRYDGKKSN